MLDENIDLVCSWSKMANGMLSVITERIKLPVLCYPYIISCVYTWHSSKNLLVPHRECNPYPLQPFIHSKNLIGRLGSSWNRVVVAAAAVFIVQAGNRKKKESPYAFSLCTALKYTVKVNH